MSHGIDSPTAVDAAERQRAQTGSPDKEEALRLELATTGLGTFDWDLLTDRVKVSVRLREMLSLPENEEVIGGEVIARLVHPEDREMVRHFIDAALDPKSSGSYAFEVRVVTAKGTIWLLTFGQVQFAGEGSARRAVRIIGNDLDITERKRAEQALRESQERQALLLDLSDSLRPLRDSVAIQEAACQLLGDYLRCAHTYYAEIDRPTDSITVARDYQRVGGPSMAGRYALQDFPWVMQVFQAGRGIAIDDVQTSRFIPPEARGALAAINVRAFVAAPLSKAAPSFVCLAAVQPTPRAWTTKEVDLIQEVAERTWAAVERARAEATLRQVLAEANAARALAESANRAKDEFLATLSHELRTPLSAILLWAGALRSGAVPSADLRRAVDAILESASTQSRLIEDLLDLSRLTAGKLALAPVVVDVAAVVQAAIDQFKPLATLKRIELTQHIEPGLGHAVLDPGRLRQVLSNLLSNALKFTQDGGRASLSARRHEGALELIVSDNGEGITAEFMPFIFQRFRQADMGDTRRHMGLGIGLAISRQLIELQGGTIEAQSAGYGQGATFVVRLPWSEPEAGEMTAPRTASPLAAPLRNLRVLLVEDDANTREAMRYMLEAAGAQVTAAINGADALATLAVVRGEERPRPGEPEVIVSDLGLPGVSGLELITRVAQAYEARGLSAPPACAVSAHAREVDRQSAVEAGFDVYVAKPVTAERLIEAVADLRDILASKR